MVTVDNSVEPRNITLRELFVKDLNGTTITEVFMLSSHLPFFTFITIYLEMCIINNFIINNVKSHLNNYINKIIIFILEFVIIVSPTILIFTVWSEYLAYTFLATMLITFMIIIFSVTNPDNYVLYWKLPYNKRDFVTDTVFENKQPFITYFRSLIFIATATSILGVDFHIYPRRFAKTETYGVSIMDMGVGLFVMSNAFVKKINLKAQTQGFYKAILESLVFVILGIIRYYGLQHVNYQEHVTEYGVHWNFFFTLAIVKFISYIIMKISKGYNLLFGITILILHQYLLSSTLETYVLSQIERDGWFNANREGIVSSLGYISLYLIGVSISNIVNSVDTKYTTKYKLKTLVRLLLIGICLLFITYYLNITVCRVSRRLANFSYITMVTSLSVILLGITLMIELLSVCFFPVRPIIKSKLYLVMTPSLLEMINFNGLLFFLSSNLLTGLVNMCINDLDLDRFKSMLILTLYMAMNCAIVFLFGLFRFKLKLW